MKHSNRSARFRFKFSVAAAWLVVLSLVHSGCFPAQTYETYYGRVVVPRAQEFRWSDGGLPEIFDPAFAAAPPDTDAVRAIFEGLTDYEPRSLTPVPAVATRWESSEDGRVWTFYLRDNARWSNGEPVTAGDFVRSWQRIVRIGQLSPHTELFTNILGTQGSLATPSPQPKGRATETRSEKQEQKAPDHRFGAEAIGDHVLRVHLRHPDSGFPALVAHPVFRPVKSKEDEPTRKLDPTTLVSNGAFELVERENDRVSLAPAAQYWGREEVALQRVEFVDARDTNVALAAYRAGEVDAVTNAPFEPLALKLLAPYKDFRRATYGALTYYSFNISRRPFDDVRVREALAIAIDRERIIHDDLDGAGEAASRFLPETMSNTEPQAAVDRSELLDLDIQRARQLLAKAGYADGKGFPVVRLLVNRNEQQRIVAQSVAAMWRNVLGIETEIVLKNWDEYETALRAGDYDVVRRGMVMRTTDEFTNMRMMFRLEPPPLEVTGDQLPEPVARETRKAGKTTPDNLAAMLIESEAQAMSQLRAMPIYFASSYSLVKPYIAGFDSNVLDAPSLRRVRIDSEWREPKSASSHWPQSMTAKSSWKRD